MAFNVQEIHKAIEEHGLYYHEDDTVGAVLDDLAKHQPLSVEGLDFLKDHVIDEKCGIMDILKEYFLNSVICGFYKCANEHPDIIFSWMKTANPEYGTIIICFQWFTSASEVRFWPGSHRKKLEYVPTEEEKYGISEVLPCSLNQEGISKRDILMPNGGLIIHDCQTAFQWLKGKSVSVGCTRPEWITWKMRLGNYMGQQQRESVLRRISDMETDYFKFPEVEIDA